MKQFAEWRIDVVVPSPNHNSITVRHHSWLIMIANREAAPDTIWWLVHASSHDLLCQRSRIGPETEVELTRGESRMLGEVVESDLNTTRSFDEKAWEFVGAEMGGWD